MVKWSIVMQHIKSGHFAGEVNYEFCTWCIRVVFSALKMTPQLSKLIKAFKFYNWRKIENSFSFSLNVFVYIQENPQLQKPPFDVLNHNNSIIHLLCETKIQQSWPGQIWAIPETRGTPRRQAYFTLKLLGFPCLNFIFKNLSMKHFQQN